MDSGNDIKTRVKQLTDLLPMIEARLTNNLNDIEAIGMLDEVVSQLEDLAQHDQGINNILDGLYEVQRYIRHGMGDN